MNDDNKFDWGETVKVKDKAPTAFRPGQIASICEKTKIKSKLLADKHNVNMGDWVYTIEYIGGSDTEIPECYLEKYENDK